MMISDVAAYCKNFIDPPFRVDDRLQCDIDEPLDRVCLWFLVKVYREAATHKGFSRLIDVVQYCQVALAFYLRHNLAYR